MESHRKITKVSSIFSFPVSFDGGLLSSVRAELINELIRYIMYERQQIPLPFDHVKREVMKSLSQKVSANQAGKRTYNRLEARKPIDAVNKLEETFAEVIHAFEVCPEIREAVIILGATPVSPKEVYLVKLPPLNPEAENLGSRICIKSLVKQLVTQDPLGNIKQIRPTNMALLLRAPRLSGLRWFYPKPNFKLTNRGTQFHFCFSCACDSTGSHDLSAGFSFIDLSGFEPLEASVIDPTNEELTDCAILSNPSSGTGSISSEYVCIDSDHDIEIIDSSDTTMNTTPTNNSNSLVEGVPLAFNMQYGEDSQCGLVSGHSSHEAMQCESPGSAAPVESIWFQSPFLVKGYKDKPSRDATFGGVL